MSDPAPFTFVFSPPSSSDSAAPFVFDGGAAPRFSLGVSPAKSPATDDDDDNEEDTRRSGSSSRRSGGSSRNPFQSDVKQRALATAKLAATADEPLEEGEVEDEEEDDDGEQGEDDEEENGEDEEGEDDEGDDMDSDDEGDEPYPHWEEGPTTVACEQCGEFIPRTALAQHEKSVCSETPLECPFAHLHCGATAHNRRLLRAHVTRNIGDHMVWIFEKVAALTEQVQTLTDALQSEATRRAQLEKVVEGLTGSQLPYASGSDAARRGGLFGGHTGGRGSKFQEGGRGRDMPASASKRDGGGGRGGDYRDRGHHGGGGGGVNFSSLPSAHTRSPPLGGRSGGGGGRGDRGSVPSSNPEFEAKMLNFNPEPLTLGANRWTPHSIPVNKTATTLGPAAPAPLFPLPLVAGGGNVASEEQTRLKVAAGMLPASALQAFASPSKAATPGAAASPTTPAPAAAGATVPAGAAPAAAATAAPASALSPGEDDLPALVKQMKSVLNKLSANNFEKLSGQVVEILSRVQQASTLTSLVVLLFDKAVIDSFFSNIYAQLCAHISATLPPLRGDPQQSFKRFLLIQCQSEFEAGGKALQAEPAEDAEALASRKAKQKARMLGTIRFIGELYLRDLIVGVIMHYCITHLLPALQWTKAAGEDSEAADSSSSSTDAAALEQQKCDAIEVFCKLLATVGAKLDSTDVGRALLTDTAFPAILAAQADKSMPARLRFMLKDLVELRQHKWRPRQAAAQVVATSQPVGSTAGKGVVEGGSGGGSLARSGGGVDGRVDSSASKGRTSSSGRGTVTTQPHPSTSSAAPSGLLRTTISVGAGGARSVSASPQSSASGGSSAPLRVHHDSHAQNSMFNSEPRGKRTGEGRRTAAAGGSHSHSGTHPRSTADDREYSEPRGQSHGQSAGGGGGQWQRGHEVGSDAPASAPRSARSGGGGRRR